MSQSHHRWNDTFLLSKRSETDPLADDLVKIIIERHQQQKFHELWKHLITNESVDKTLLPPEARQYFEETARLPDFADHKLLIAGQEVFARHGLACTTVLLCKSLPQTYACGKGVEVLYQTGRLTSEEHMKRFTRRLMETAQFVINVMTPGGLDKEGRGMISAQKVRLIHASIRFYLKQKGWDVQKYDEPINQEDMAGTLMAFSALVVQGLELLNIRLTADEKEAYIHTWKVVGHIMGVDPSLIPEDFSDAEALGEAIFQQQMSPSDAGRALTEACLEFLREMMPLHMAEVPRAMVHFLIGPEASAAVGLTVHKNWLDKLTESLIGHVFAHKDRDRPRHERLTILSEHLQTHLQQGMINFFNHHKQVMFYIPPSLSADWKN